MQQISGDKEISVFEFFNGIMEKAINNAKMQATTGNIDESVEIYKEVISYMKNGLNNFNNKRIITELEDKIEECKTEIEKLNIRKKKDEKRRKKKKKREDLISKSIVADVPNVKWDDVIGLEDAKEALREAMILPMQFPSLFSEKRIPWKGILLYGPPGTGKSLMAKAVATDAHCTFFSISSSDIVSKWIKESKKLVIKLFEMAREKKPSIVFIDEVDSLCTTLGGNESKSLRRIKAELLVQMDKAGNDQTGVLVLGATNTPWNIDPEFRRRFEKKIYVGLQNAAERKKMILVHIGNTPHQLTEQDLNYLGEQTEGYTGADINNVVRNASMQTIGRIHTATRFKKITKEGETYFMPCSPGDSHGVEMTWKEVSGDRILGENLTIGDFSNSLQKTKPTVSSQDISNYDEFTKNFGQNK